MFLLFPKNPMFLSFPKLPKFLSYRLNLMSLTYLSFPMYP
jgi:hypothetical protein